MSEKVSARLAAAPAWFISSTAVWVALMGLYQYCHAGEAVVALSLTISVACLNTLPLKPYHAWFTAMASELELQRAGTEKGIVRCDEDCCHRTNKTPLLFACFLAWQPLHAHDGPDLLGDGVVVDVMGQDEGRGHDAPGAEVGARLHKGQAWVAGAVGAVGASHLQQ